MEIKVNNPPRKFGVGKDNKIVIKDCGRINLENNELVTFSTNDNKEYDVTRKDWGFYATPSVNKRLQNFGFKTALVKNPSSEYFVMLVEKDKMDLFQEYLKSEKQEVELWLDEK